MAQGYTGEHNSSTPLDTGIFTLLAGRTGTSNDTILNNAGTAVGTLSGSSQSGGKLVLQGSTDTTATQGIAVGSNVTTIGTANFAGIAFDPSLTLDNTSSIVRGFAAGSSIAGISRAWILTANASEIDGFVLTPSISNSPSGTSRTLNALIGLKHVPTLSGAGAATLTITTSTAVNDALTAINDGSSAITITAHTAILSQPNLGGVTGSTITTRRGLWYRDDANAGAFGKQPTTIAVDVENQNSAAAFTEVTALKSAIVSGTGKFFLRDTGGAQSSFAGKVTTYNAIATVEQGLVPEYAEANLTAQTANKAQTTLYAVPASGAGLYRVSGYVVVTTQATTSSTMPKIQIDWTDSDSNTAVGPFDMTLNSVAVNPTVGTNSAGQNLLTTDTGTTAGTMVISARQSTNISYRTTGYASTGVTAMQYAVHVRLEAL